MVSNNRHKRNVVNYVPGEVCLVVAASAGTTMPDYDEVRNWANPRLLDLLQNPPHKPPLGVDIADVTPERLTTGLGADDLLQDLPAETTPRRSVTVSAPGADGRELHFYRLPAPVDGPHAPPGNDPIVRQVVKLINWSVQVGLWPGLQTAGWSIVAATPNWLIAGTQNDGTDAGPGTRPEPVPPSAISHPGRWTFCFDESRLNGLVNEARGARGPLDVVVAVLDTSPTESDVQHAKNDTRYASNLLLQDVLSDPRITIDDTYDVAGTLRVDQNHRGHYLANTNDLDGGGLDPNQNDTPFRMPDHGLFATGIIRDIAPGAEIHLIRVLNDYGAGDVQTLADVLSHLPQKLAPNADRRLVVNLSLVADLPPGEQLLELWLPQTYARLKSVLGPRLKENRATTPDLASELRRIGPHGVGALAFLEATHRSLFEIVAGLHAQNVVVVAAAGNGHNPHAGLPHPPEPRWPARYDEAMGVAAVSIDPRHAAEYSNRGDVQALGNGVAVFGGNATRAASGQPPRIATQPPAGQDVDAVRGIICMSELPLQAGTNQTGWAYWAGTSFATPVIAGIAADYLAIRNRSASPRQIMDAVRNFGADVPDPSNASDPDGPLDCRTISARQKYVRW